MPNILNSIILNMRNAEPSSFTYDAKHKTKPLKDKGKLLPSRIFGTPKEYLKDIGKDAVNIGRAAQGKSNDHELGRINDLALKLGSFAIACYLAAKTPSKAGKVMEFAGFGAFFGAMSLWPKLAIQLPLRQRTGADFMRQYVDSQGRKKTLNLDPQYDLTDMLSKKDLETAGDKMGVNKNLPDRDNFIKKRIRKTTLQANTLWMASSGFAVPVMAALGCNAAEKVVKPAVQSLEAAAARRKFLNTKFTPEAAQQEISSEMKDFAKFIEKHADGPASKVTGIIADRIDEILKETHSEELSAPMREELKKLSEGGIGKDSIGGILMRAFGEDAVSELKKKGKYKAAEALSGTKKSGADKIADIARLISGSGLEGLDEKTAAAKLTEAIAPQTSDIKGKLTEFFGAFTEYGRNKKALDAFIDAGIGEREGSFIAAKWTKFSQTLFNAMGFDAKQTKQIAQGAEGSEKLITAGIERLVSSGDYTGVIEALSKQLNEFEDALSSGIKHKDGLLAHLEQGREADKIFGRFAQRLQGSGFEGLAQKVTGALIPGEDAKSTFNVSARPAAGTLYKKYINYAEGRVLGARASMYRALQALDINKQAFDGTLQIRMEQAGAEKGIAQVLADIIRQFTLKASIVDNDGKLQTRPFELSEIIETADGRKTAGQLTVQRSLTPSEYKLMNEVLYGENASGSVENIAKKLPANEHQSFFKRIFGISDNTKKAVQNTAEGLADYRRGFMEHIINWQNSVTTKQAAYHTGSAHPDMNGILRHNYTGQNMLNMITETAKSNYNSRKWLMMFTGIMAGITALTLAAGFTFGRKDKTEEIAENGIRRGLNV